MGQDERERRLREEPIGPDHVDAYWDSAAFHEFIDTLAAITVRIVDDAAALATREVMAAGELVTRVEAGAPVSEAQRAAAFPLSRALIAFRDALDAEQVRT